MKRAQWTVALILINESGMVAWQRRPCSNCGLGTLVREQGWSLLGHREVSLTQARSVGWYRGCVQAHIHSHSRWQVVAGDHGPQIVEETTFHVFDRPIRWLTKVTQQGGIRSSMFTFCRTCGSLGGAANGPGWCCFRGSTCQCSVCKLLLLSACKKGSAMLDLHSSPSISQDTATWSRQVTRTGVFPKKEVNLRVHKTRLGFKSNKQTDKLKTKTPVNKYNLESTTHKWLTELG